MTFINVDDDSCAEINWGSLNVSTIAASSTDAGMSGERRSA